MHRSVCCIERTQTEHIRLKKRKACLKKRIPSLVWLQGRPGLYALAKQTAIRIDLSDGKNLQSNEKRNGNLQKKNKTGNQECPEQAYCRAVEKDDKTCSRNEYVKIRVVCKYIKGMRSVSRRIKRERRQ